MKKPSIPKGIWAASLTPLNADLQCDCEALFDHCSDLVKRGCQGIVLFGTTGEGPSFSASERKEVLEKVIAKGFPSEKIILANGSASVSDTVDLALKALELGCQAMLIAPPTFFKNISEEGALSYYRQIIQKIHSPKLKIILYHLPQYTGIPITLSIVETLVREFPGTIVGIKESEGNLLFSKQILNTFPDLQLFVGKELHIAETAAYGGSGAICGMANLYPERICALYEKGHSEEIASLFESFKGLTFIPAAKAVMGKRLGASWREVRPPLVPLDEERKKILISKLRNYT